MSILPPIAAAPVATTLSAWPVPVPLTSTPSVDPVPSVTLPVTDSVPGPERPGSSRPAVFTDRPAVPVWTVPMPLSVPPVTFAAPVAFRSASVAVSDVEPAPWLNVGICRVEPVPTTTVPDWASVPTARVLPFRMVSEPPLAVRLASPLVADAVSWSCAAFPSIRIVAWLLVTSPGSLILPGAIISYPPRLSRVVGIAGKEPVTSISPDSERSVPKLSVVALRLLVVLGASGLVMVPAALLVRVPLPAMSAPPLSSITLLLVTDVSGAFNTNDDNDVSEGCSSVTVPPFTTERVSLSSNP